MVVVEKTSAGGEQTYVLPNTVSGQFFVRVSDTDRSRNEIDEDVLHVEKMYVRSDRSTPELPKVTVRCIEFMRAPQHPHPLNKPRILINPKY